LCFPPKRKINVTRSFKTVVFEKLEAKMKRKARWQ
jgi:hypothetical protein